MEIKTEPNNKKAKLCIIEQQQQLASASLRRLLIGTLLLALIVCLTNPFASQLVGAKKVKEKKILKQLVKSLILKNLSTKKNFVPMPVPIPGKWQQILNAIIDSGLLFGGGSTKSQYKSRLSNGNNGGGGGGGGGSSSNSDRSSLVVLDSLKNDKNNKNKINLENNIVKFIAGHNRLNDVEKYTRVAAAKYAGRFLSNQISTHSNNQNKITSSSIISNKNNLVSKLVSGNGANLANRKSSANGVNQQHHKNDLLVTMFNLVKLVQQLRQLDRSKLLNVTKKSLFSPYKKPPSMMLSMNINNRKSFMNEMNYIHKLTTEFNHRHRHNYNTLFS